MLNPKWRHDSTSAHAHPLTLQSDLHPISPYNITPESKTKVTRIKEMITT